MHYQAAPQSWHLLASESFLSAPAADFFPFLTFFSFHQYSTEINLNLDRYVSLLVQNVQLKVDDTMSAYEDIALCFYDDADVLAAVSENARIGRPENESEAEQVEKNTYIIETPALHLKPEPQIY